MTTIDVGGDIKNGIVVSGDNNRVILTIHDHGSRVADYRGLLPTPTRRSGIHLLPRRDTGIVGRDRELAELRQALGANSLIQLCGPPEIGKSALLRHAARSLEPGLDGVVYLHADDREASEIAHEIFKACYDAPDYLPSTVELQQHLEHLRLRIYLDDLHIDEAELKQLTDIVQSSVVVFTTEKRVGAPTAARTIPVGGLDESAAVNLLALHLKRPLRDDERPAVRELCAAVHGSPLQLQRAAASSRTTLPASRALPELVRSLVGHQLPEAGDVLYLVASVGGGDLAPAHINALLGRADSEGLCRKLVQAGLLTETEIGYRCSAEVTSAVLKRRAVLYPAERLCRYLTDWAADAATSPDAVADHHRVIDALVRRAEQEGRPDLGVALARAASPKLERSLRFSAWGTLLGAGWSAAEKADDKAAKAYFMHEEGIRCLLTRKLIPAGLLLAQAAVLWHELNVLHQVQAAQQAARLAASKSLTAPAVHSAAHNTAQAYAHMNLAAHGTVGVPHGSAGLAHGTVGASHGTVGAAHGTVGAAHGTLGAAHGGVGAAHGTLGMAHGSVGAAHGTVGAAHALAASATFTPPTVVHMPTLAASVQTPAPALPPLPPRPQFNPLAHAAKTSPHTATPGHALAAGHTRPVFNLGTPQHTAVPPTTPAGPPARTPRHLKHHHLRHGAQSHTAAGSSHGAVLTAAAGKAISTVVVIGLFAGGALAIHSLGDSSSRDPGCQTAVSGIGPLIDPANAAADELSAQVDDYKSAGGQGNWALVQSAGNDLVGQLRDAMTVAQNAESQATTPAVSSALGSMASSLGGDIDAVQGFVNRSTDSFDTRALADEFNTAWDNLQQACTS